MKRVFLIAGLILITGGIYLNSFPGSFHYDDFPLLLDNPVVTGQSFPLELFLGHYWGRPFTLLSFHSDYQLFGSNPFFYHFSSFCLHLLVVVLIYLVVRNYCKGEYVAFATALIFAVHPIQSQAVNYVWSRSVLLMSVFVLLCLLFCRRFPILSLGFLQLAIWSRAEAILLVGPLILLTPSARKPILMMTSINAGVLVGYLFLAPPENVAWTHSDPVSFWFAAPLALWKYLGLMLWPSRLTIDHPNPAASVSLTLAAVCALALLLTGIVRYKSYFPWLLYGFAWILLFLAPSLLIPNSDLVNESRSYLAFAGYAFVLANLAAAIGSAAPGFLVVLSRRYCGIDSLSRPDLRAVALPTTENVCVTQDTRAGLEIWPVLLIVCLLYVPMTLSRNEVWQDDTVLWEESVAYAPTELRARYNLGVALVRAGQQDLANTAFEQALELSPQDDFCYAALGYCAEFRGSQSEAIRLYRTALSLNPKNIYARLRINEIGDEDLYH